MGRVGCAARGRRALLRGVPWPAKWCWGTAPGGLGLVRWPIVGDRSREREMSEGEGGWFGGSA
jgi:hypothetical protein